MNGYQIEAVPRTLAALRAENERLRGLIDEACNALTDSIKVSGNNPDTNMHFVRKLRKAAAIRERTRHD